MPFVALVIMPHLIDLIMNICWDMEPLFMFELVCQMHFYDSTVNTYHLTFVITSIATSANTTGTPSFASTTSSSSSILPSSVTTSIGLLNYLTCTCIINSFIRNLMIDRIPILHQERIIGHIHLYHIHLHLYVHLYVDKKSYLTFFSTPNFI